MTPKNVLSRSHHTLSILVFLLALLASVGTATAGELGEVGVIHPDGRVELDFDRFTSAIQVEDGNTVCDYDDLEKAARKRRPIKKKSKKAVQ